jgi:hypothetical protein
MERHDLRSRPSRAHPWETTAALWAARRTLRAHPVPPAPAESSPKRELETETEAVSS